ncbi:MAG: lipase, partial [Gammaproteobacteria bacterium]|nr:lipase [Gammaproteobacteria bacterium]
SGQHFYNLRNLANSRDNLRQGVADLLTLQASLPGLIAADGSANASLDSGNVTFVGHSLGGIIGGTYLAFADSVNAATLAMPGGGIAQLLANSETFGGEIADGLTAAEAPPGSPEFAQFLLVAQTLIDSGDPINHAAAVAGSGVPVHMIEVIGDAVIPNSVATAPLSGTEPLAAYMGLGPVSNTTAGGGLVRFSAGDHGSILNPTASLEATVEMQTQAAVFAASGGTNLLITNPSVIQGAN